MIMYYTQQSEQVALDMLINNKHVTHIITHH